MQDKDYLWTQRHLIQCSFHDSWCTGQSALSDKISLKSLFPAQVLIVCKESAYIEWVWVDVWAKGNIQPSVGEVWRPDILVPGKVWCGFCLPESSRLNECNPTPCNFPFGEWVLVRRQVWNAGHLLLGKILAVQVCLSKWDPEWRQHWGFWHDLIDSAFRFYCPEGHLLSQDIHFPFPHLVPTQLSFLPCAWKCRDEWGQGWGESQGYLTILKQEF